MKNIFGSLSAPSKMPCHSHSTSAHACNIGNVLARIPGTVCAGCYAKRGNYTFKVVREAHKVRLRGLTMDLTGWQAYMITSIRNVTRRVPYFRWHDSGDLQSWEHLVAICNIARALPDVQFWLPTKEYALVRRLKRVPDNLTVRVSHPMVGSCYRRPERHAWACTSSVGSGSGFACPAKDQGNKCLDCRACWDKSIVNIDYNKH